MSVIDGFEYYPSFLAESEEEWLATRLSREAFESIPMRGQKTRRSIVSFGLEFRPLVAVLAPAPPIPSYLHGVRGRVAEVVGLRPHILEQSLLTHYPAGSDIGWHRDHPSFGDVVAALSLLGDATLFLRRAEDIHRVNIGRRSLYVLRRDARYECEHRVKARAPRLSITFRPVAVINKG